MHSRQAELLAQAEELSEKLSASPVLWKYVDSDSGQEFFLTVRLPNVHSPFTGKSLPQRPEKYQIPAVQKELRQVEAPGGMPMANLQRDLLAQADGLTSKLAAANPVRTALLTQAEGLLEKLAASPVLWKYVDEDSGKEFFLPTRMQNVHSPYTGKSVPQRPEKHQIAEVGKELRDVAKGVSGAPGPKSGAPKNKKKHAADDLAWKSAAAKPEVIPSRSYKHKQTGATASLYGAVPWTGRPGDKKEDWEVVHNGYTISWPDGTIGIGKLPFKSEGEAEQWIKDHPNFKGMGMD